MLSHQRHLPADFACHRISCCVSHIYILTLNKDRKGGGPLPENNKHIKGLIFVIIGAALWGIGGTAADYIFRHTPVTIDWYVTFRLTASGIILLSAYALFKETTAGPSGQEDTRHAVRLQPAWHDDGPVFLHGRNRPRQRRHRDRPPVYRPDIYNPLACHPQVLKMVPGRWVHHHRHDRRSRAACDRR